MAINISRNQINVKINIDVARDIPYTQLIAANSVIDLYLIAAPNSIRLAPSAEKKKLTCGHLMNVPTHFISNLSQQPMFVAIVSGLVVLEYHHGSITRQYKEILFQITSNFGRKVNPEELTTNAKDRSRV
ncbi:hypothetical protein CHS0354_033467 [Potamilus streckersoni]|uniref:Uncharacterized protein n=1 Tax=Potamilus streckersoni TaxID=2493646 RepID=A0AAE0TJM7_9BIVA|nr:hypothetical protein CHS0354_033467 [Potamilus streckersoni]